VESGNNDRILICSDGDGEGGFIVAMELADRRPQHMVLRATKFLSDNTWSPPERKALLESTAQVRKFLDDYEVHAIVVDNTSPLWIEDRKLLLQTIQEDGAIWEKVSEGRAPGMRRDLSVFHRRGKLKKNGSKLTVPLTHTLRRDLAIE